MTADFRQRETKAASHFQLVTDIFADKTPSPSDPSMFQADLFSNPEKGILKLKHSIATQIINM